MVRSVTPGAVRAVTFDYWQTLVSERPGEMRTFQVDRVAAILDDARQSRDRAALETAFTENWTRFERNWLENLGPYTPTDTVDFLGERLGLDLGRGLRERLIDGFHEVGRSVHLRTAPGIERCLDRLKTAGVRLGIVCDVGLTSSPALRARLEGFGLLRYFDAWAFSDETGWFKPAAEAFAPALEGLGIGDPSGAAHVGDNRRTDVAGALGLGMLAVLYTGLDHEGPRASKRDPGPVASFTIADHAELPDLLGIA